MNSPPPSITCERCGLVSTHLRDVREGWCGACEDYTGAIKSLAADPTSLGAFDVQGVEVSFGRWVYLTERKHTHGYGRVGSTEVGQYRVSTVWLGLDHRFLGDGPPIIFETMVFAEDGPAADLGFGFDRYCTLKQACAGHARTVAELRALVDTIERVSAEVDEEVRKRDGD